MRAELIKLHERLETTTIYVTHDQIEAMTMATRIVVMKDGRIQQIGAPKEIYDNPNNMFVGGFIGTPAMNFLQGEIKKDGYFHVQSLKLKVPEEKIELMKAKDLTEVPIILGIRPEDLHDDAASLEKYKDSKANLTVDVAELLGAETNIHITIGDSSIIAKVDARSDLHIGDKLELAFNMEKCHFFDPETELRITKQFTRTA
jgi:multiple sugar transport system ATP-binding protein